MNITPYQAIVRMKQLTDAGVSFSLSYQTLNKSKKTSNGIRRVEKAMLRKSMRNEQSDLANQIIEYTDIDQGDLPRHFYFSLLLKFNEYTIKP